MFHVFKFQFVANIIVLSNKEGHHCRTQMQVEGKEWIWTW